MQNFGTCSLNYNFLFSHKYPNCMPQMLGETWFLFTRQYPDPWVRTWSRGGGEMRSPGLAKNADKCGKNAENAAKNTIENAVWLEWCLPLKTPMFRLVLHNWALKAWTV